MARLETGSTPAQQRARLCAACQTIKDKCRDKSSKERKSYSITSDDVGDQKEGLPLFKEHEFGRG